MPFATPVTPRPVQAAVGGRERAEQELASAAPHRASRPVERRPHWASAASISPFHDAIALSSRSGLGRCSRSAKSRPAALVELAAEDEAAVLERLQQLVGRALAAAPTRTSGPRRRRCRRPGPRRSRRPRGRARAARTRASPRRRAVALLAEQPPARGGRRRRAARCRRASSRSAARASARRPSSGGSRRRRGRTCRPPPSRRASRRAISLVAAAEQELERRARAGTSARRPSRPTSRSKAPRRFCERLGEQRVGQRLARRR